MADLTQILNAIEQGDLAASEELLPLVYQELRALARRRLAHERPGQTLQATALVHEAYLRLVGDSSNERWKSREHFFCAAAEAMRRILVEKARQKLGPQRGGDRVRVEFQDFAEPDKRDPAELLQLDEALERLAVKHPVHAKLVKLRYFAGLSHQEAADALGLSRSTADRCWKFARAFLFASLNGPAGQ